MKHLTQYLFYLVDKMLNYFFIGFGFTWGAICMIALFGSVIGV